MDVAALLPIASAVASAAAVYIKTEMAKKAGEKMAEVIGEKAGEAAASGGTKALTSLRSWFTRKKDDRALHALQQVEVQPDTQNVERLTQETVRVALSEPEFAQELKVVAEQFHLLQPNSVLINNNAPNEGAQGVFNAPVTFNRNTKDHD